MWLIYLRWFSENLNQILCYRTIPLVDEQMIIEYLLRSNFELYETVGV